MIVTPKQDLVQSAGFSQPTKVLNKGQKYFVYAVEKSPLAKHFYVIDASNATFPVAYNAKQFNILDSSIPDSWKVAKKGLWKEFISFSDWANSFDSMGRSEFYEKLVDSSQDDEIRKILQSWEAYASEELDRL